MPPGFYRQTLSRISDGLIAIAIVFVAQLLLAGIQYVLDDRGIDFPPSIVAMTGIFLVFSVCGYFFPGVEDFYRNRLKRAADLLNRHMSIGFTIPFIMILKGPISDAKTIGAIIGCFVLTGLLNTILAYIFALPLQCLMVRWDKGQWNDNTPSGALESAPATTSAPSIEPTKPRPSKLRAPVKSLCDSMESSPSDESFNSDSDTTLPLQHLPSTQQTPSSSSTRLLLWALTNPLLITLWLLTLTLGLPLRLLSGPSSPLLSTLLLFSLWLSTLTLQSTIKSSSSIPPSLRTILSGLLNPVLFTSLGMSAYIYIEVCLTNSSLSNILSSLQSNTTVSSFIAHHHHHHKHSSNSSSLKAGDIALSILNSGLVSWGLKLYEYRTQLLSRAGLTVFSVSSILAGFNVICGPLIAHSIGVKPDSRALSFAARSVTLALGNPVMQALGGDVGLNAAMVVVSGIVFQMGLGFGVGGWLEGRLFGGVMLEGRSEELRGGDVEAQLQRREEIQEQRDQQQRQRRDHQQAQQGQEPEGERQKRQEEKDGSDDPRTVAAGVTVGINAAAMGTAYLYEVHSEAAPYSALSMMALGIMSVVFSCVGPLAAWVAGSVVTSL
ncbi:hypothetical protein QBC43DRAFT_337955 [Cladorrhinum sp. PSN259]|nr:hypothetical protein QBC43DRAFT_337955 [Cladorrhinum sp. PSN259]